MGNNIESKKNLTDEEILRLSTIFSECRDSSDATLYFNQIVAGKFFGMVISSPFSDCILEFISKTIPSILVLDMSNAGDLHNDIWWNFFFNRKE